MRTDWLKDSNKELNISESGPSRPVLSIKGKKIKLDIESDLEGALVMVAILGAMVFLVGIFNPREFLWLGIIGGVVAISAGTVRYYTDNYYILDLEKKRLVYHFQVGSYERYDTVATFDQIYAVTVDGTRHTSRRSRRSFWGRRNYETEVYWTYHVLLILKDGRKIKVTPSEQDALEYMNDYGAEIARETGAVFVPGKHECRVSIEKGKKPEELVISHRPYSSNFFGL